ncbi:MAG: bifunctional 2-C-methyl-D-erythritol 4-phosphate cytidylyltransferase/2-C-methyl-D-erythritol 2,4-cyclodiphosphate synthase [Pseudomonadota bacterium]
MKQAGAVIVAAGQGSRMGSGPEKQYRTLLGRRVISWSAEAFLQHESIAQLVIVAPRDSTERMQVIVGSDVKVVPGGSTRTESVRAGLNALDLPADSPVLIHDAARPGLSLKVISSLLEALNDADASAPALLVPDALKCVAPDNRLSAVDRAPLRRIQTPQAFRLGSIVDALEQQKDLVDDLAAMEAIGAKVSLIAGHERLSKLTYEDDFEIMSRLLSTNAPTPRLGTGYDVHKFGTGDHVILCGVKIPHSQGLVGHSDADIGWHALTDAILGALALGDIGDHFPPSDPKWKDAESGQFLKHAQLLADDAGYAIGNVDITLICEEPKIKPHRDAMRTRTAELLELPLNLVSVKATTSEGLGFTGRREGIAGQAAAVLTPKPMVD